MTLCGAGDRYGLIGMGRLLKFSSFSAGPMYCVAQLGRLRGVVFFDRADCAAQELSTGLLKL